MQDCYKADLAYIHDVGYGDHALRSAPGILDILAQNNISEGLIVDLGCGTGLSALEFTKAGYSVLGIDISSDMIALARPRVPQAEFRVASLFQTEIPPCNAVTAIGECLNYLFDADNDEHRLLRLFKRIYQALTPGGVFIFDILEPGQSGNNSQQFDQGSDWIVLIEKEENLEKLTLTRRITTLRKVGDVYYERDDEVHHVRLYRATSIAHKLRQAGFNVQTMRSYGQYALPKGRAVFVARKPIVR